MEKGRRSSPLANEANLRFLWFTSNSIQSIHHSERSPDLSRSARFCLSPASNMIATKYNNPYAMRKEKACDGNLNPKERRLRK